MCKSGNMFHWGRLMAKTLYVEMCDYHNIVGICNLGLRMVKNNTGDKHFPLGGPPCCPEAVCV